MTPEPSSTPTRPLGCLRAAGWGLSALVVLVVAGFLIVWTLIAHGLSHHPPPVHGPGAAALLAAGDTTESRLRTANADGVLTDAEIAASAGPGEVLDVQRTSGRTHITVRFTGPGPGPGPGASAGGGRGLQLCLDYYVEPGRQPRKVSTGGCPNVPRTAGASASASASASAGG